MPTSGSESRPQTPKVLESKNYVTGMSDSKPGLVKSLDSKGGVLKTSESKAGNLKASLSKTVASRTSESRTGIQRTYDSKTVIPKSSDSKAKASESKTRSSKMSELKIDNQQTTESTIDNLQRTDSKSDSSKSSESESELSKSADSKSTTSRATESMLTTSESKPRVANASESKPRISELKSHTADSTLHRSNHAEPWLRIPNLFAPFIAVRNFLRAHIPIFSRRATKSSIQEVTNTQKELGSNSAVPNSTAVDSTIPSAELAEPPGTAESLLDSASKPAAISSANQTTSQLETLRPNTSPEGQPGPHPDRFFWSRTSYSVSPTQLLQPPNQSPDSVPASTLDPGTRAPKKAIESTPANNQPIDWGPTNNNVFTAAWLSDSSVPENTLLAQPAADIPEAGLVSPQMAALMALNYRRRASIASTPERRKSVRTHRTDEDYQRSRSTTRIGKAQKRHKISFKDRIDPDEPFPASKLVAWDVDTPVMLYMASAGPLAQKPTTVMSVLRQTAVKHPNRTAYGIKEDGQWRTITYQQLLETVYQVAKGLIKIGLERFNIVGILGCNSPEWVISHLAVIFAGGTSAPMHVTNEDEASLLYAKQTKCRFIVVDSAKEVRRLLVFRKRLPHLLAIVQCSREYFQKTEDVYSWDELLELGQDVPFETLNERSMQQAPNFCCSIVQTVGTGAQPKPVMLSHDNVTWGSNTIGRYLSINDGNGVTVSLLPLSCIVAQVTDIYIPIRFASTVYFAPLSADKGSVFDIVRDVRPTVFWSTSRLYDTLRGAADVSWSRNAFKRLLKKWAINRGLKGYGARLQNRPMPLGWRIANATVFKRIRNEFGLGRCVELNLGGDSVRKDVWRFYYGLNMDLLMFYGLTESAGQHTMSLSDRHRMSSVGLEMDGCTTMIDKPGDDGVGEFLIKGRNVAMGYLYMKEKTLASFTEDGWFRTGDLGKRDEDGFLYVIGRIDQQIHLSTGETVLPVHIEFSVHRCLPCVDYCMVVGKSRPHLGLLMTLKTQVDPETGRLTNNLSLEAIRWFKKAGYRVSTTSDVVPGATKRMLNRVQEAIDRVNDEATQPSHKIKRWTFLPQNFSIETGEIGPSSKIRRWVVEEKYMNTIDSLFV